MAGCILREFCSQFLSWSFFLCVVVFTCCFTWCWKLDVVLVTPTKIIKRRRVKKKQWIIFKAISTGKNIFTFKFNIILQRVGLPEISKSQEMLNFSYNSILCTTKNESFSSYESYSFMNYSSHAKQLVWSPSFRVHMCKKKKHLDFRLFVLIMGVI